MTRNIIVPVDLPDQGRATDMVETARALGGNDAQITLVHVVEDVPTYVAAELPGGVIDKAKESAREELTKIAQKIGVEAQVEVRSGQPATAILAAAKERSADVIIIASHDPGFADYFLGSTAARVVRHAHCSVYVMR